MNVDLRDGVYLFPNISFNIKEEDKEKNNAEYDHFETN